MKAMLPEEDSKPDQTNYAKPGALITHVESLPPADNLIGVIARAVSNPAMDVEKMERLFALQERIMEQERKIAYAKSMARLQGKLPQIDKYGVQLNKDGTVRNKWALYDDIDAVVRPMLAEEGFSRSYNEESAEGKIRKFSITILHKNGHEKTWYKTMPFDQSNFRPDTQSESSTVSLARRQLLKMALGIVEKGEDTDGEKLAAITPDQAKDLEAFADEVKANKPLYLAFMGASHFDAILQRDLGKATAWLQAKKDADAKKKT